MNNILIIVGLFGLSVSFSEIAFYLGMPNYICRSISHISAALISLLLPVFLNLTTVVFFGITFSVLMLLAKELKLLKGMFKHNGEEAGPILFPIGLTIAAVTFWGFMPFVFQISCLVVGLSDALAGIIGKTWGKITYQFSTEKTVEGSLVFLVTTITIFLSFLWYYKMGINPNRFGKVGLAAILLTAAEGSFGNGWDNLILPFVSGFAAIWVFA